MNTTIAGSLLRRAVRRPEARQRLFCFPHAGGAASTFRTWPDRLPGAVELVTAQYAGREDRMDVPMRDTMSGLVADIVEEMAPLADVPFALFGHSMGAAVAYEVALALRLRGMRQPTQLFVSAREAPDLARGGTVHLRDDDGLCAELIRLGGTTEEVLAHREMRELILPMVRNDYRLIETYEPTAADALECPITVLRGDADPEVTSEEALAWRARTRGRFEVVVFPGDHFYLVGQRDTVLALLAHRLGVESLARKGHQQP
ncbi:MAG: alpha/beta fold hydrolase [Pseudonocardiaceae bacterium]|nr:alpha/beta fold hydrolase [Pseudonocardiaceae bacterium]